MKTLRIAVISAVVVLASAAFGVGLAFAQNPTPTPPWGGSGSGWGRAGGYGMMGGYGGYGMMGGFAQNGDYTWMQNMHGWMLSSGSMHTLVWNGLADALDLTPEQLSTELASGKTLLQIAEARGVSQAELTAALEASIKAGLDQAVADGALTREQADWMLSHMAGQYEWMITRMGSAAGFGPGGCHGYTAGRTRGTSVPGRTW